MAVVHLMVGFIGFGKTTIAKKLAQDLNAVCLTHDDIMVHKYGRNPDDFATKYKIVDDEIRCMAKDIIKNGQDVVLDYGFWSHEKREEYYKWAKSFTEDVVFHVINCDLNEAKKRVIKRTLEDKNALMIDENVFDILLRQYEPWDYRDNYPVVWYFAKSKDYIGQIVKVKIDRPKMSKHPKYGFIYPINYGYVPYTKSQDGEELDVYVLGVDEILDEYEGQCIGVVSRIDDNDDKLIVVPIGINLSNSEIEKQIEFQEKWFKHILIRK